MLPRPCPHGRTVTTSHPVGDVPERTRRHEPERRQGARGHCAAWAHQRRTDGRRSVPRSRTRRGNRPGHRERSDGRRATAAALVGRSRTSSMSRSGRVRPHAQQVASVISAPRGRGSSRSDRGACAPDAGRHEVGTVQRQVRPLLERFDVIGDETPCRLETPGAARRAGGHLGGQAAPLRGPVERVMLGPRRRVLAIPSTLAAGAARTGRHEQPATPTGHKAVTLHRPDPRGHRRRCRGPRQGTAAGGVPQQ